MFDNAIFHTPTNEIILYVQGEETKDVCFKGGNIKNKEECFEGISPQTINLK